MNIFNAEVISQFFVSNYFLFLNSIFLGTFGATWYLIPKIIWVTNEKELTKPVIARSVHVKPIPTFGGVAFFMTIILSLSLVQALRLSHVGNHLIAAVTILFMVGIKDDLVVSTARVKLVGQLLAIAFLVFSPELELNSLNGFLGLGELSLWFGYTLAGFILLAIINSYNLIDGIDGLAAVAGIIMAVIYTVVFYLSGEHYFVLVSMSVVGMLGGFLRFNFSRGRRKIFMGDSGALIIGLLIGFLTLKVLSIDAASFGIEGFLPENRLLLVLAVLYIPFFDTTRSILIRLLNKKSPFEPDRNHTHHVLLDAGCTHMQATLLLGLLNSLVVTVFLIASSFLGSWAMSLVMLSLFGLSCWGFDLMKKKFPAQKVAEEMAANVPKVNGTKIRAVLPENNLIPTNNFSLKNNREEAEAL